MTVNWDHRQLSDGTWLGIVFETRLEEKVSLVRILDVIILHSHEAIHEWWEWIQDARVWQGEDGWTPDYSFITSDGWRKRKPPTSFAELLDALIDKEIEMQVRP